MANIFAQLGFDGVLLGRIDYQDKNYRMATKTAEMVWRGSNNLGSILIYYSKIKVIDKIQFSFKLNRFFKM